jgi:2,4-dienoyl-CoA reductase-like NADH-dependent reductase (Old Yellow Enzyme family)
MASQSRSPHARIFAQACVIGCGLLVTGASQAMEGRPSLSAACRAWDSHIAELIDQHRTAHELDDDQIGDIIRLFYEAQSTCSALRFEEGLAIYEAIPIGPVASRFLR